MARGHWEPVLPRMLHKERWSTSNHDTLPQMEMAMKYASDLHFDGLRVEGSLARRDTEESLA